jgi:hypothetical protein
LVYGMGDRWQQGQQQSAPSTSLSLCRYTCPLRSFVQRTRETHSKTQVGAERQRRAST